MVTCMGIYYTTKYLQILCLFVFFSKPGDKRPVSPVVKDTATAYADNDERVRNDIQSSYSVSTNNLVMSQY